MKACIQRVNQCRVVVEEETVGQIGTGLLVLLGVAHQDTQADLRWLADKIAGLRIFEDDQGKMNRSLTDVGGAMLVVSQFTLLGDCRKGRRPSFMAAAPPDMAEQMYDQFVQHVRSQGIPVETGQFQKHMQVELTNDGPVTMWLETELGVGGREARVEEQ